MTWEMVSCSVGELNRISFHLDKPIWKSKTHSKVKSFICTTVLNRTNTNDVLQVQRSHRAISTDVCYVWWVLNLFHIFFCTILWLNLYGAICLIYLASVGYALNLWTNSCWLIFLVLGKGSQILVAVHNLRHYFVYLVGSKFLYF